MWDSGFLNYKESKAWKLIIANINWLGRAVKWLLHAHSALAVRVWVPVRAWSLVLSKNYKIAPDQSLNEKVWKFKKKQKYSNYRCCFTFFFWNRLLYKKVLNRYLWWNDTKIFTVSDTVPDISLNFWFHFPL